MFSYVYMKILERRPRSYDRRMARASRGRVRAVKEAVVAELHSLGPESRVLEVGCGTGELAALVVAGGLWVDAFDQSPAMVAVARERILAECGLADRLTVRAQGVDAMDGYRADRYSAVISTLVFSELTDDERRYALRHAHRVLRTGGLLVLADEVVPRTAGRRLLHSLGRAPLVAVTYLASGSTTRPLRDLVGEVEAAGFVMEKELRSHGDAFALLVARRRDRAAQEAALSGSKSAAGEGR